MNHIRRVGLQASRVIVKIVLATPHTVKSRLNRRRHLSTAFPVGQICSFPAGTTNAATESALILRNIQVWPGSCC